MAESNAGTDRDVRATESGIPVERVYDAAAVEDLDLAGRLGRAGRVPLHPGHPPHDVPRAAVDDAPVRRLRHGRGDERPLPLPARRRRAGALDRVRPADPARHGLRRPAGRRRGGAGRASPSTRSRTWRALFDGIPLDRVSTSMTINAPAAVLLLLYQLVAEEGGADPRGAARDRSRTTCSRSTSRAATTSSRRGPRCGSRPTRSPTATPSCRSWNTISISGYHIREAGSTAVQEVAFTLANGIAYVEAALAAGLEVDRFAPAAVVLLQRPQRPAARRSPSSARPGRCGRSIMRDRFGATEPQRSMTLRFHAQTGGSTLTAQQPREQRRARGGAGAGRGARRRPVDPLQRLRRGAGPARPRSRPSSPCAPSRSSPPRRASPTRSTRSGAARTRRAPDRRARGAGPGADRRDRPPRRGRRRASSSCARRSPTPPSATTRRCRRASGGRRASTRYARTTSRRCQIHRIDPRSRRTRWRGMRRVCASRRDAAAVEARLDRACGTAARGRRQPAAADARGAARARARWARSAACCARSSASTTGSGRTG